MKTEPNSGLVFAVWFPFERHQSNWTWSQIAFYLMLFPVGPEVTWKGVIHNG